MAGTGTQDHWAAGDLYERYVGRWSRLVAARFLDWLGSPPGLAWLDVGCGTGALAAAVADRCAPRRLAGADSSAAFLEVARVRLGPAGAEFHHADARALPFADAEFDRTVSALALNFVPDPARAAAEMARVTRPGGEVALYVWDYAAGMEMMRRFWDAAVALDPRGSEIDESRRFPICRPEALHELFASATPLEAISTHGLEVPTVFADFDDYWGPFLAGQGPAPAYCRSLPPDWRSALRERVRATLPAEPDGSIRLVARAWALRGTLPG